MIYSYTIQVKTNTLKVWYKTLLSFQSSKRQGTGYFGKKKKKKREQLNLYNIIENKRDRNPFYRPPVQKQVCRVYLTRFLRRTNRATKIHLR